MNYRLASIQPSKAITADITETYDINILDPISQIIIQVKGTNGDSVADGHPAKHVTKIEIVDGSDVLYAMEGIEAQAMDFYHNKKMPLNIINYLSGSMCVGLFQINFGRYLYDPLLAFDPKRFKNPQLKITYDFTGGGGASTSAMTSEIVAHCFDEKDITPVGFLMQKEVMDYTMTAAAWKYIDLPVDYPYKMLMVQALTDELQPWEQFNKIKLHSDNTKKVIIDENTSDLLKYLCPQFGLISENVTGKPTTNHNAMYCTPGYEIQCSAIAEDAVNNMYGLVAINGGILTIDVAVDTLIYCLVQGYCPHGALAIPFGDPMNIEDWFDVRNVGNLRLEIYEHASASGALKVCLSQLRPY